MAFIFLSAKKIKYLRGGHNKSSPERCFFVEKPQYRQILDDYRPKCAKILSGRGPTIRPKAPKAFVQLNP